ncbi:metallophosphoesterase [Zhongshania sp.]|uniref:metallophosphoesterase n=1 Tax=Zhongshania sp. TaxID=1971902 RepID=UPI00356AF9AC
MSKVWFCSDLHLGHGNAIKWRTQFETPEDHDSYMFGNIATMLGKRDSLYVLGDAAINDVGLALLAQLPPCAKKVLVIGNHDTERGLKIRDFLEVFDDVQGFMKYKKCWLSHAPIHPAELRDKPNIHGHVHDGTLPDKRYFNVCPENLDKLVGRPLITFQEIQHFMGR